LRKVGWKGGQAFDVDAFDEIYRWTGGIARRINMLCSRAIVSRAAGDERLIDAASVALVAREERNEMGETGPEPPLLLPTTRHAPRAARSPRRPVLFLVASLADHVKAAALMAAMAERIPSLTIKLVRVHDDEALALSVLLFDGLDLEHGLITLGCAESAKEARRAELERKLKDVVDKVSPKAVVVFDDGEEVIGCATVARSMGLTVVHVGNGLPAEPAGTSGVGGRKAVGALADWWYPTFDQASRALALKGVPTAGIHCVGSLLVDAVQMALRISRDPMRNGAIHRMVVPLSSEDGRYALVVIEEPKHVADRHRVVALLAFLRRISRSIALVLLMRPHAEREFDEHRLPREIFDERMCYLRGQEYANQVELLRHAACVLTDSPDVREEASALHTPCLAIGTRARSTLPGAGRIASSEGEASASAWAVWPYGAHRDLLGGQGVPACTRIAEHLGARLKHPVAPPFIL
jgi:UDP-N-acetylglucosamine 2-epimerase